MARKIEARLPDGTILEFPEGTPDAVIDRTVRGHLGLSTAEDVRASIRGAQTRNADIPATVARMRRAGELPPDDPLDVAADVRVRAAQERRRRENAGEIPPPARLPRAPTMGSGPFGSRTSGELLQVQDDLYYRPQRDRRRWEALQSDPLIADVVAFATNVRGARSGPNFPWLWRRQGQNDPDRQDWRTGDPVTKGLPDDPRTAGWETLSQELIADIVINSRGEIEGLSPRDAAIYLFGRRQDRPPRGGEPMGLLGAGQRSSRSPLATPPGARPPPRYQGDLQALGRTAADPQGEREGWEDHPVDAWISPTERYQMRRARIIRQERRKREREGYYDGLLGGVRGVAESGLATAQVTAGSVVGAIVDNLGGEGTPLSQAARAQREVGSARFEVADPGYEQGSLPYYIFHTAVAIEQMGGAIAVGATTRNPQATALAVMGMQSFAQKYDESRRAGRSPRDSLIDGGVYAIAEVVPERMALAEIMRPGGTFLGRVARGSAAETLQEEMTEIVQIGYDSGVLNEKMTWEQARRRLTDAGLIGGGTGGTVAGGHHIVTGGQRGADRRDVAAEQDAMVVDPGEIDAAARDAFRPDTSGIEPIGRESPEDARQRVMGRRGPQVPQEVLPQPGGGVAPDIRPVSGEEDLPAGVGATKVEVAPGRTATVELSPDDEASPIPSELIARGRGVVQTRTATAKGVPAPGTRVVVDAGNGATRLGTMSELIDREGSTVVRIEMDDGRNFEEHLDDLNDAGVSIRALEDVLAAPSQALPDPETARAGGTARPAPAAPGAGRFVDTFSRYGNDSPGQRPGAPRPYRHGTHAANGRDFGMPINTPLLAEMDWEIVASPRRRDAGLSMNTDRQGKWFAVRYADQSVHIFRHVSTLPTRRSGRAGEQMALSGNTGIGSSGPHTHRESWVMRNGALVGIDPLAYIRAGRAGQNVAVAGGPTVAEYLPATPEADSGPNLLAEQLAAAAPAPASPLPIGREAAPTPPQVDQAPAAEPVSFAPTRSGRGLAITGLSPREVQEIRDILPSRASLIRRNDGAQVIAPQYERQVRDALDPDGSRGIRAAMPQRGRQGTAAPLEIPRVERPAPAGEAAALPTRTPLPSISQAVSRVTRPPDVAITGTGREIPVRYAIVDGANLVTSNTPDGRVNPAFPAELQPRDRERGASQVQVSNIAANLDPRLLGLSPKASDGAPIIEESGVVLSGNGRALAIQRAYDQGGAQAASYRQFLEDQGFDIAGLSRPMLVRVADGGLSNADLQAFTREANERDNLSFSASETAQADAAAMGDSLLDLYRGGDIDQVGNRDFARTFIGSVIAQNDQANMVDAAGQLSQQAVVRIRGALLAKAYDNPQLLAQATESTDSNIKAIAGAMTDVAAVWARMRAAAKEGRIDASMDATKFLNEAVATVDRARREGRAVTDYVNQRDIFSGVTMPAESEGFLRLMFVNRNFTRATGRARLAEALRFYVDEAMKTSSSGGLFGEEGGKATPLKVIARARDKQDGGQDGGTSQGELLRSAERVEDARAGEPAPGEERAGPERADVPEPDGEPPRDAAPADGSERPARVEPERQDPEADGRAAFAANRPRKPPARVDAEAWLKGWDAADRADLGREPADRESQKAGKPESGKASPNTIFTDAAAEKARAVLRERFAGTTLTSGLDPELAQAGLTLAGYHIEKGARTFAAYAKAMIADLGDAVRPYLRSWYESIRYHPGMETAAAEMSGPEDIGAALADLSRPVERGKAAGQEPESGVQGTLFKSNARASAEDVQRAAPVGRARRAPADEDGGGTPAVRDADRPAAEDVERRGEGSATEDARGASGPRDADRLPVGDADGGRGRRDDTAGGVAAPATLIATSNYRIEPGALAESRSAAVKARDNLAAIEIVKRLDEAGRPATIAEQEALARYVGWGGLKGAFDPDSKTYLPALKELLTEEEYETARRSIQYAHYTPEKIIRPIWTALERMGFRRGRVFEPGMGTGNFLGMMPAEAAATSSYTGIEFDGITARIAELLYPRAGVLHADFTRQNYPQDYFDLVIGNPPFSQTVIRSDPRYSKLSFVMHDFFFAKSIDMVRPGGALVFVTSAGTMNKVSADAREYLADRADLVGAVRLPGGAFAEGAGTEVTADIIVLRKRRADEEAGDRRWTETVNRELEAATGGTKTGAVSRYFSEHPEMVLGEEGFFDKLYPDRYGVHAKEGVDLEAALRAALDTLPADILPEPNFALREDGTEIGGKERKDGSFYISDGRLMQQRGNAGVPVEARGKGVKGGIPARDQERIRALVPIRDALREVYSGDMLGQTARADAARTELNRAYDAFVQRHGPINKAEISYRRPTVIQQESARSAAREEVRLAGSFFEEGSFDPSRMILERRSMAEIAAARRSAREAAEALGREWDEGSFDPADMPDLIIVKRPNIDPFMDDQEGYRLRAIEHYEDVTGTAKKGAVFFENIITKERPPNISGAGDALLYTLNRLGRPDIDEIARLADLSRGQVLDELSAAIFKVPGQGETYQTRELYLSGNVRVKLEEAKQAAERDATFRRNVEALEAIQPTPLGSGDISAHLGMPWLPTDVIEDFGKGLGLGKINVRYRGRLAQWSVDGDRASAASTSEWGTSDRDAISLIQDALNRQEPKVYKKFRDPVTGKERDVLDETATQAAQDKVRAIRDRFVAWVWEDTGRADLLAGIYNRDFNNLVAPVYDGEYLTTPGIASTWSWRPHQRRVIARIIQSGNTYAAHSVGAGKTSEYIGAGMEMRRLGLISKPMYTVPNHMLGQFTKEFYEQYPLAEIMVADERQFHTDRRKQFVADMATRDLDAVIITHSAFGLIPMSDEFQAKLIRDQIDDLRDILDEVKAETKAGEGRGDRVTQRRIEQQVEALKQRLEGMFGKKRDQVFTFEETGVDFVFVDEAHLFRKLDFATRMGNVRGVDPAGSGMSFDLFTKIRYLEGRRPGRSAVFGSGTPVTNTMAELFSISRYLQPDALEERGLAQFDAWAGAFGETVTALEQDPAGGYKPQTRFARFVNIPELSAMVRQVMDVVTSKQLEQYVVRPKIKSGRRRMRVTEAGAELKAYQRTLEARMKAIQARRGPPQKGDDILLSVIGDGRKAAIDMRLVRPGGLGRDEASKLEDMIGNVHATYQRTRKQPFHRPLADGSGYEAKPYRHGPATQLVFSDLGINGDFPIHQYIRNELVKRGIPRQQIAIISEAKSHVARQRLFNDMNEGKVSITIGSVPKMGTGMNAQRQLYAIHNLDPQWYPANDEQRNGRGLRQGNENPEIEITDYSTKGTYDSQMWNLMEVKARFIEGFFAGDPTLRTMDDLGEASQYEQAKAITTADPRILELTGYKQDLERALIRRAGFEREQYSLRERISDAQFSIERAQERIPQIEADIAQRTDISGDKFTGTVGAETFTTRAEFGEAVTARLEELASLNVQGRDKAVGELAGFKITADVMKWEKSWEADLFLNFNGERQEKIHAETPAGIAQSVAAIAARLEGHLANQHAAIERNQAIIADLTPQTEKRFEGQPEIEELRTKVDTLEGVITREAADRATGGAPRPDTAAPDFQRVNRREFMAGVGAVAVAGGFDLGGKLYAQPPALLSLLERAKTEAVNGRDVAGWIAEHSANPIFRRFAAKIAPLVDGVKVRAAANRLSEPEPAGLLTPGNIDIHARPTVHNRDGTISTVDSISITEDDQVIIIPRISEDGRHLTDQQAIDLYHEGGRHLGIFDTVAHADTYAEHLHEEQDREYSRRPAQARHPDGAAVPREITSGSAFGGTVTTATGEDAVWLGYAADQVADGLNERTAIHELTHAAIRRQYGQLTVRLGAVRGVQEPTPANLARQGYRREATPRPREQATLDAIDRIWRRAVTAFEASEDFRLGVTEVAPAARVAAGSEEQVAFALENPDEMISWAIESPQAQAFLRALPSQETGAPRSLWDDFIDFVRRLFGMGATPRSALDDVLDATDRLLSHAQGREAIPPGPANRTAEASPARAPKSMIGDAAAPDEVTVSALLVGTKKLTARLGATYDVWRTWLQDRMLPLLRTQQAAESVLGRTLTEGENAYLGEELMSGRVGAQLEDLAEHKVAPLFEAMKEERVTVEELESYLYARHAPERNARIVEINPEFEEGHGSGMSDIEAAAILARIEKAGRTKALETVAKRVDMILKLAMDVRVQTGLLSEETAAEWRSTFKHYVPLRGFAEVEGQLSDLERPTTGGSGITVRGPESKQAFGRRSKADDILAYSIMQAEEAIIRGGKNDVARRLYELVKAAPDPEFWKLNKVSMKRRMNPLTGLVESYPVTTVTAEDKDWTVSLKIGGKSRRITMNRRNPAAVRLAEAMRRLDEQKVSLLTRFFGSITRFLSAANTTFNPEFVITNAFRDAQTATANLAAETQKGIIAGTLKDYRKALVASMRGAFDRDKGEWGDWYREFVREGGRVYFNKVQDLASLQKDIRKQMKRLERKTLSPGGLALTAKGALGSVGRFINNVNLGVENAIRLSAYKNGRQLGMTPAMAASLAKNLTVNFNRRGTATTWLNAAYMFFNAGIQGSARLIIALKSKRVRRIAIGMMVFGAALDMLNAFISGDDDDGESFYSKISDFEKSRNLIIMIPGGGNGLHIKIPLPYGFNIFYGAGRGASELARGRRPWEVASSLTTTIVDSFNPVGGTNSIMNFFAPTVVDPIVDITTNRDFAGRPIMPDNNPFDTPPPDSQRYFGSVNPVWIAIAQKMNRLTGGDDVVPGWIDVSPETLEHLFGTVTGAAGAFYDRASSLGVNGVRAILGGDVDIDRNDIPLVRKLVGEKPRWYDRSAFYTRARHVEEVLDYAKRYRERGENEAMTRFLAENRDVASMQGALRQARRQMRLLRREDGRLELALGRGAMTAAQVREAHRRIDDLEARVISNFNATYLATVRAPRGP